MLKIWGVVGVVALAAWVYHLNVTLVTAFEGKKFTQPSRVYGRPLDIYDGIKLEKDRLLFEINRLGYTHNSKVVAPGEFNLQNGRLRIWTRGFRFWDGQEESVLLTMEWDAGVVRVKGEDGESIKSPLRLEPIDIGGIYPAAIEDRILLPYGDFPQLAIDGLLAVEDHAFFDHFGVRPTSIGRALLANIRAGRIVQGGSTITQQLVKNFFLGSQQTLSRKVVEALMALLLELQYDKEEILETYLNQVYFGQNGRRAFHGFGLASQRFFAKELKDLRPQEMATLVGMLKGPGYYNPRTRPERAQKRRDEVLAIWLKAGVIDTMAYSEAIGTPLRAKPRAKLTLSKYPDFVEMVKQELMHQYDAASLAGSGYRIFTTLDPYLQEKARQSLTDQYSTYASRSLSGALITLDAFDGGILSLVGKHLEGDSFNRALEARRPVGSLVKPFVYMTALEKGRHWASLVSDEDIEVTLDDGSLWVPDNFDKKSHGDVMLIDALSRSYNKATVRLGLDVGLSSVVENLYKLGVDEELRPYPSLLLGAFEMTPFEVAKMYQPFASDGFRIPVKSILAVTDSDGDILSSYPLKIVKVVSEGLNFQVVSALNRVVRKGTARALSYSAEGRFLAGKTGTSQNERDSWFVGFGDKKVSVVWLGNDDNKSIGLTGASGALRVFGTYSRFVDHGRVEERPPKGYVLKAIDENGGLLPSGCTGEVLVFAEDVLPEPSSQCGKIERVINWWKKFIP